MNLGALQIQAIVDATKTPTPEQVRVVEAPRRPLLVVAGAGSGKTETMSMRVLWLLANHPDLTPSSILGLTFTRKAAGELGERLRERIRLLSREMPQLRERLDEDPAALTYNSFAERIVSEHGMRTPRSWWLPVAWLTVRCAWHRSVARPRLTSLKRI